MRDSLPKLKDCKYDPSVSMVELIEQGAERLRKRSEEDTGAIAELIWTEVEANTNAILRHVDEPPMNREEVIHAWGFKQKETP